MAKNIIMGGVGHPIVIVDLAVTVSGNSHTTNPVAGDPVLATAIPGVAEGDKDSVTALTPVNVACVAELVVNGITTGGGNAAINAGDVLYMQTDGTIDKNSSGASAVKYGTAFGNALQSGNNLGTDTRSGQLVASGSTTTTIRVWVGKF